MNDDVGTNAIESLVLALGSIGHVHTVEGIPHLVTGRGAAIKPLEDLLENPRRTLRRLTTNSVKGLIQYVTAFANGERSRVFQWGDAGRAESYRIRAIMDYHEPETPHWCSHEIEFAPALSESWKAWVSQSGEAFSQAAWLEHLEEFAADLVNPPSGEKGGKPAELITLASKIQITKSSTFESAHRLSDGQTEIHYQEKLQAASRQGKVTLPDRFWIRVPVFEGGEPIAVQVWLRIRVRDGSLSVFYKLHRPALAIDEAWGKVCQHVATALQTKKLQPMVGANPNK